eukprot:Em0020g283a
MKELLSLVPDSLSCLVDELRRSIPFKTKPVAVQEVYVRNALYVISYCPALCEAILRLLFNHLISVDVEVPKEPDEEEEVQFEVTWEKKGFGFQSFATRLCSKRNLMHNEMADKMDVLMSVMQEFILFVCCHEGTLNEERTDELFKIILKSLSFQFVDHLWNKCEENLFFQVSMGIGLVFSSLQTPAVFRQAAAGYIASYIARAKFLCVRIAKYLIETMMCWIHGRHELAFCYTILEQNRRLALPSSSQGSGSQVVNVLDCFFPFDPYCLKRSYRIIEPLYQEWEEEVGARSVNEVKLFIHEEG